MVVIDSLKLIFLCDLFVGASDRIQCNFFFLPGRRQRLMSLLISIYKTVGYCLDDCFASCENIVCISFKRMYGKLLPPPPWHILNHCTTLCINLCLNSQSEKVCSIETCSPHILIKSNVSLKLKSRFLKGDGTPPFLSHFVNVQFQSSPRIRLVSSELFMMQLFSSWINCNCSGWLFGA